MKAEELKELLSPHWETRSVECKAKHPLDVKSWLTQTTLRACLGFSNEGGGGYVVVGVGEGGGQLKWDGFAPTSDELRTWTYQNVGDRLREFADPTPRFQVTPVEVDSKVYVVVRIFEFDDVPVLCAKESSPVTRHGQQETVLKRGALYSGSSPRPS